MPENNPVPFIDSALLYAIFCLPIIIIHKNHSFQSITFPKYSSVCRTKNQKVFPHICKFYDSKLSLNILYSSVICLLNDRILLRVVSTKNLELLKIYLENRFFSRKATVSPRKISQFHPKVIVKNDEAAPLLFGSLIFSNLWFTFVFVAIQL